MDQAVRARGGITHRTHMRTHTHTHRHRHVHRGLFQRHRPEATCTQARLWKHHLPGSASPPEPVMASQRSSHVYSLSTVCRGSQLVLHDQDLVLFFQQTASFSELQYHFTDKKAEACCITRLPHGLEKGSKVIYFHIALVSTWASIPMSVGIKLVYTRSVHLFQGIYD